MAFGRYIGSSPRGGHRGRFPRSTPARWWAPAIAVLTASACAGFDEPALQPVTTISLTRIAIPPISGKSAQFDIMAMDQENHQVFAADALDQGIDIVDVSSAPAHYLRTVHLDSVPNGVAYAPDLHRLYTGNTDSSVSVIDVNPSSPSAYAVLATISTGGVGSTDLVDYDAHDHKIYATNPDDGYVSAIDATTNTVVAQIQNLGTTEQPAYNAADGMEYVPGADNNTIIKIDPRRDVVVGTPSPIPVVCVPHGLAIDPATDQGLIGCGDKDNLVTVAWDFHTGTMLKAFDFAGGGDQVVFDAKAGHFYFAAQGYAPPEMAIFNASPITFLTAVPTSHHSLNVAYDETHHLLYTIDGRHLEASLWSFPDPVFGCAGHEAVLAAEGAPRSQTPDCHPEQQTAGGA
jgi:YVTN family beta-propeller protein